MMRGTVKWFGGTKRDGRAIQYGFIELDPPDSHDVFVHATELAAAGLIDLNEGDRLEFELKSNQARAGGLAASKLRRLS